MKVGSVLELMFRGLNIDIEGHKVCFKHRRTGQAFGGRAGPYFAQIRIIKIPDLQENCPNIQLILPEYDKIARLCLKVKQCWVSFYSERRMNYIPLKTRMT